VEVLDDFPPPALPPHCRRGNLLPVLEHQRVRQVRVGIGLGLVVVGRVRSRAVHAVGSTAELLDVQKLHHPLVILLGGQLHRRGQTAGIRFLRWIVPPSRGDNGQRRQREGQEPAFPSNDCSGHFVSSV